MLDPQSSILPETIGASIEADELVIVANAREVHATTSIGKTDEAARELLSSCNAAAVVVKAGISGAFVYEAGSSFYVPPHPTPVVWPIGSGDAFTAGFAKAWFGGATLQEAAKHGSSAAAAFYVSTRQATIGVPEGPILDLTKLKGDVVANRPTVYLAGSFASLSQRWLIRIVRGAMADIGIDAYSPLHENGPRGVDASEVATKDLEGLDRAESVLVLCRRRTNRTLVRSWVGSASRHSASRLHGGHQSRTVYHG